MEEQPISFETAKLAKEKGFEEFCIMSYFKDDKIRLSHCYSLTDDECRVEDEKYAPTQSLLQKWLRETHNIHVNCIPNFKKTWNQYHLGIVFKNDSEKVDILIIKEELSTTINKLFESYEEALEEGLQEALKLIK